MKKENLSEHERGEMVESQLDAVITKAAKKKRKEEGDRPAARSNARPSSGRVCGGTSGCWITMPRTSSG